MPSLKVGLHEWVVVDLTNNPIELWTSGLSGCVAVAIITPKHAFVTHINSAVTTQNWENTVENEFKTAIEKMGDINLAKACMVVGGQNPTLYNAVVDSVDDIMNAKTKDELAVEFVDHKSGVTVSLGGNKPSIKVISNMNDEPRQGTLNSNTGHAYCIARGFFTCATSAVADLG